MVIDHADDLLMDRGYLGLNLDELAERVEYSKATLYHHFVSKEDLVLAVVTRHLAVRRDFFARAVAFRGLPRERMFAIGIADRVLSRKYPHGFPLMQLVRQNSIWSKCSETRQRTFSEATGHCFAMGLQVAEAGVAAGDFAEWSPSPDQVVWGLVSLSKGAHLLAEDDLFGAFGDRPEPEPMVYLFDNYHRFLDGTGWQPLTREFDYETTRVRVEQELFRDEIASLP